MYTVQLKLPSGERKILGHYDSETVAYIEARAYWREWLSENVDDEEDREEWLKAGLEDSDVRVDQKERGDEWKLSYL